MFWFDDFGECFQVCIWYFDDVDVWFDCVEWVVFGGDVSFGQCIEQGGFVDVG